MPSNTSGGSRFMSELASQMISQIGTIFDRINVSPSHAITAFPLEGAQNYLYVLYSANGMPLLAGAIVDSMDRREHNRAMREIQGLASSGFATSFRDVELGSDEMARHVERWVKELFEAALPLADGFGLAIASASATGGIVPVRGSGRRGRPRKSESAASETPAPARRRGRPRKSEAAPATEAESTAPRRRGRPRKSESAAETPAPAKRRGRPAKNASTESAPRRRGRPRKSESAASETPAPPRRRGRPRKSEAAPATEAESTAPRRRGRPRKSESVGETPAPTKRRGRPAKSASTETGAATGERRRGRPRKNAGEGSENAGATKRRGRPRKDAEAPEAASAPRRRGRPRKNAGEGSENAGTTKRRGRPRKDATEQNGGEGGASASNENAG